MVIHCNFEISFNCQ